MQKMGNVIIGCMQNVQTQRNDISIVWFVQQQHRWQPEDIGFCFVSFLHHSVCSRHELPLHWRSLYHMHIQHINRPMRAHLSLYKKQTKADRKTRSNSSKLLCFYFHLLSFHLNKWRFFQSDHTFSPLRWERNAASPRGWKKKIIMMN